MIHNRKQTKKIIQFAKEMSFKIEQALVLKSIPMEMTKRGDRIVFKIKD